MKIVNVIFIADSEQSEKDAKDKMEEIADRWVSKLEGIKYLYVIFDKIMNNA